MLGSRHAGDHQVVLGRVRHLDIESAVEPLLLSRGGYGSFLPLSLAAADADLVQGGLGPLVTPVLRPRGRRARGYLTVKPASTGRVTPVM
jgi:hypothetical protein